MPAKDRARPGEAVPERLIGVPWGEVAAAVGDSTAVILADDGDVSDVAKVWPAGWSPTDDPDRQVVVVVDPVDEQMVSAAASSARGRPVVLVAANLGRPSYARALLTGGGDGLLPGRGRLNAHVLARTMASRGYLADPVGQVEPAVTGRPLDDLLALVAAGAGLHDRPWAVRRYEAAPAKQASTSPSPFLSVLVRTRGRRATALADVFLCLAAQTCPDFEVLVLAHDLDQKARATLDSQIETLPAGVRNRVQVVPVAGGGRARPLMVGTGLARGAYVAVLDDDDLVLGHWVATFAAAAPLATGQILRSIAMEQDVAYEPGSQVHSASSWPRPRWDAEFSLLSHLVDNHSPVHSYAYPREVFHELGLRFNESLPVLEDWDLLVRAASLVGVHDTGEVTAIYRRWPAGRSSFAEVAEHRWPDTAWAIVDGWDLAPLLLPAGSAVRLRREGIAALRHRPLRVRVRGRLERGRDRWSPRLLRTPFYPALRRVYRWLVPPDAGR